VHSVFGKINYGGLKHQQLILEAGTAIWWVTEPHLLMSYSIFMQELSCFPEQIEFIIRINLHGHYNYLQVGLIRNYLQKILKVTSALLCLG
jgi:hypothetical protein